LTAFACVANPAACAASLDGQLASCGLAVELVVAGAIFENGATPPQNFA